MKTTRTSRSLWANGDSDPLVKHEWGQDTAKALRELGFKSVDFRTYKGLAHSADMKEMDDLGEMVGEEVAGA